MNKSNNNFIRITRILKIIHLFETNREEETFGCLLQKSPKFYNNVFLFVGLTT